MVINNNIKYTPEKPEKCTSCNKIKNQKKEHPLQSREYTKTDHLVKNEIKCTSYNKIKNQKKDHPLQSREYTKTDYPL